MSEQNRLQKLVGDFADAVVAQDDAMKKGDVETGNRFAAKYFHAGKELVAQGDEGISTFAHLLVDPRINVRCMAASFLIPFRTEESITVLKFAAEGKGIVALGAIMSLKRWQEEQKGITLD